MAAVLVMAMVVYGDGGVGGIDGGSCSGVPGGGNGGR